MDHRHGPQSVALLGNRGGAPWSVLPVHGLYILRVGNTHRENTNPLPCGFDAPFE